jgi:valyl-tRNA synthetase
LNQAIREITSAFAEYKFNEATQTLYRFFWSEYCDWYVEASKATLGQRAESGSPSPRGEGRGEGELRPPQNSQIHGSRPGRQTNTLAVIDFVLSHTLRLFHPFLPFITEDLWHGMGYHEDMPADQGGKTIMFAPWPKPLDEDFRGHYGLDDCYLEMVDTKYELVTQGRNLRREANIAAGKKVKYVLKPMHTLPEYDIEVLKLLLNAETLEVQPDFQPKKGTPVVHSKMGELYLPLEGLVDFAAEKARLKKELEKVDAEIVKVETKLANPAFTQKVPVNVLAEHQQRLVEWQTKRERLLEGLSGLDDNSG